MEAIINTAISMEVFRLERGAAYWDGVFEDQSSNPQPTWRGYIDDLHKKLVNRWLSGAKPNRLLKTDLFEEAVGNGLHSILQQDTRMAVGMDLSWRLAQTACSRQKCLHGIVADSRVLPFMRASFDGILSISTLDHFASSTGIQYSLFEIARVLQPGGILILTLDNLFNPLIALRQYLPFALLNHLRLVPYYVGYTCGPNRLRNLLKKTGFEVLEMTAIVHCPRVLVMPLARRLDRQVTPRNRIRLHRLLEKFEALASLPTRFLTGHFIAVKAMRTIPKPEAP
jgi:SAM-dependent methyltransferase